MLNREKMDNYLKFIADSLPEVISVEIPKKVKTVTKTYVQVKTHMGLTLHEKVKLKYVDKYSLSLKINIKFDKYDGDIILHTPTSKSIDKVYSELRSKISRIIGEYYTQEQINLKYDLYVKNLFKKIK